MNEEIPYLREHSHAGAEDKTLALELRFHFLLQYHKLLCSVRMHIPVVHIHFDSREK